jgi:hypothetical protein
MSTFERLQLLRVALEAVVKEVDFVARVVPLRCRVDAVFANRHDLFDNH